MSENTEIVAAKQVNKFAHLRVNTKVEIDGQTYYVGPGGNLYTSRRRENVPTLPEKPEHRKPGDKLRSTLTRLMQQKVRDPELYGVMINDPEMLSLGVTREQIIGMQLVEKACQGDLASIEMLYDRMYGKSTQHIEEKKEVTLLSYSQFLLKLASEDKGEILEMME